MSESPVRNPEVLARMQRIDHVGKLKGWSVQAVQDAIGIDGKGKGPNHLQLFSFAKRIDVSLLWLMDPESTISRTVPPNFNAGRDDFTDDEILLVRSFRAIGGATKITAMALSPLLNVPPVDHGGETDQPKMTNVESPARSRRKSI